MMPPNKKPKSMRRNFPKSFLARERFGFISSLRRETRLSVLSGKVSNSFETKEYLKRTPGILSKRAVGMFVTEGENVGARTRSPLRIRASNKVIDFSIGDQALSQAENLSIYGICCGSCRYRW